MCSKTGKGLQFLGFPCVELAAVVTVVPSMPEDIKKIHVRRKGRHHLLSAACRLLLWDLTGVPNNQKAVGVEQTFLGLKGQNGISRLNNMFVIYHSGLEPSILRYRISKELTKTEESLHSLIFTLTIVDQAIISRTLPQLDKPGTSLRKE